MKENLILLSTKKYFLNCKDQINSYMYEFFILGTYLLNYILIIGFT